MINKIIAGQEKDSFLDEFRHLGGEELGSALRGMFDISYKQYAERMFLQQEICDVFEKLPEKVREKLSFLREKMTEVIESDEKTEEKLQKIQKLTKVRLRDVFVVVDIVEVIATGAGGLGIAGAVIAGVGVGIKTEEATGVQVMLVGILVTSVVSVLAIVLAGTGIKCKLPSLSR